MKLELDLSALCTKFDLKSLKNKDTHGNEGCHRSASYKEQGINNWMNEWMNKSMPNHSSVRECTCLLKHCTYPCHTPNTRSKRHVLANNMRQNVVKLVIRSPVGQRSTASKMDEVWICSFMSCRANFWLPSNHEVVVKYSMNSPQAVNLNQIREPNNLRDGKR